MTTVVRFPWLLWRTLRLIRRGLDRHLERSIEIMEDYDAYLRRRGLRPDEDARSMYYREPGRPSDR